MKTDPEDVARIVKWQKENPDKVREHKRNWARANRQYSREKHLKRKYGMSIEDFNTMLAAQDGKCAICKSATAGPKGWAIDHDHATGVKRGILCMYCNLGLGHFKDNSDNLRAAIKYLAEGNL